MDSLTQIVLGAAVGEIVLGRRAGNRAMLWGGIGGTLPDLDVVSNFTADQLGALAYHRSISHSLFFSILAPVALGWLVHRLYRDEAVPEPRWWRQLALVWLLLALIMSLGGWVLPVPLAPGSTLLTGLAVSFAMILPAAVVAGVRSLRKAPAIPPEQVSQAGWTWLFFWSIVTHPLLDCCTTYGTQFLQPFSDLRIGFDNISVVDPVYTLPFLICVLLAARLSRGTRARRIANYVGLALSTGYMLLTFVNKQQVNRVFEASLQEQNLPYQRFMTTPTIFNNVLWHGVAESDTVFYLGLYSFFDDDRHIHFDIIPKNHQLLAPFQNERSVKLLDWFSEGYYSVHPIGNGRLQFNDLRFGVISRSSTLTDNFVFKYELESDGLTLNAYQREASRRDLSGVFEFLWKRMMGEEGLEKPEVGNRK